MSKRKNVQETTKKPKFAKDKECTKKAKTEKQEHPKKRKTVEVKEKHTKKPKNAEDKECDKAKTEKKEHTKKRKTVEVKENTAKNPKTQEKENHTKTEEKEKPAKQCKTGSESIVTVCKSLKKALHWKLGPRRIKQFINFTQKFALTISHLRRDVTLFANGLVLHCIANGIPFHLDANLIQQFFKECMAAVIKRKDVKFNVKAKASDEKSHNTNAVLAYSKVWNKHVPESWNYQTEFKVMSTFKDSVARELATITLNSLFVPFFNRQRSALRQELYQQGLNHYVATSVVRLINSPKSSHKASIARIRDKRRQKYLQTPEIQTIVERHQEIINPKNNHITELVLQKDPTRVVRYYNFLAIFNQSLCAQASNESDSSDDENDENDDQLHTDVKQDKQDDKQCNETKQRPPRCRSFSLLPITNYAMSAFLISNKGLNSIVKKLGWFDLFYPEYDPEGTEKKDPEPPWHRVFLTRVRGKNNRFTFASFITTDGVKASMPFSKRVSNRESNIWQQGRGICKDVDESVRLAPTDVTMRVVGVDPGRKQLVTIYDPKRPHDLNELYIPPASEDTKANFRSFSKKQYYHSCKLFVTRRRMQFWDSEATPKIRNSLRIMSQQVFKTGDVKQFHRSLQQRALIDKDLWTHFATQRSRKLRFLHYQHRQKTLDKICKLIMEDQNRDQRADIVVAYGNGKFPTSAKGQPAGPLGAIPKRLKSVAKVIMVDEHRTSKVCSNCTLGEMMGERFDEVKRCKRGAEFKKNREKYCNVRCPKPEFTESLGVQRRWWRQQVCDHYHQRSSPNHCGVLTCSQVGQLAAPFAMGLTQQQRKSCDYKFRNRDKNAARNITRCLLDALQGIPRHEMLQRTCLLSNPSGGNLTDTI